MIGIGLDAVDVPRFRAVLARRPRISQRLFTDAERAYAGRRADPTERLAARFAAKEALLKSLGAGIG
ncbi:MAG: 4'-phosphopantetheinyl transferase superfamily protein, partial [Acidimicrobiia bacterium]|nr:4'-phosphopantetheinyl transferase superfamily protein [Acidimicrobiia bacterium]